MKYLSSWIIFIVAAFLEVGGDAIIRKGLRGFRIILILSGCAILGCYGIVVNTLKWDFGKLLGTYVAVFALISILFGRFVFKENIPITTWVGLVIIVFGGLIIQFGQ
jgi:drug/metabolite transporter superfamily protein YnfA